MMSRRRAPAALRTPISFVRSATAAYLDTLTDAELQRVVRWYNADFTIADLLARILAHTACHAGEIAALKGLQGVKGPPFSRKVGPRAQRGPATM